MGDAAMSNASSPPFVEPSDLKLVFVRVCAHLLLAGLLICLPALGDSRFLFSGFILFVAAPFAGWAGLKFRDPAYCWIVPLCDLSLIIFAAWCMPVIWTGALCLALMVALSPSISLHPRSNLIYAGYGVWMLIGMGSAFWLRVPQANSVISEGWILLGIAAVYPTLIVYANWQRQRALALLEQAQLLAAVSDMSGSVAHDFNNVLMAISGHAELVGIELPKDHPAQESLQEVVDGTSRASLLCGQLLAFGGRGKHDCTTLDLTEEVHTIVGLLRPALPSGVSIDVAPFSAHLYVFGERSEIQQVLLNIIVNAGEAMSSAGGRIAVSLARSNDRLREEAVVTVQDHGPGMVPGVLHRIFDPFFTTKDRGHGLGLASVKRIMRACGGDVEIDSEPGQGTRVVLRWPEAAQPATVKSRRRSQASGSTTIEAAL